MILCLWDVIWSQCSRYSLWLATLTVALPPTTGSNASYQLQLLISSRTTVCVYTRWWNVDIWWLRSANDADEGNKETVRWLHWVRYCLMSGRTLCSPSQTLQTNVCFGVFNGRCGLWCLPVYGLTFKKGTPTEFVVEGPNTAARVAKFLNSLS